MNIIVVIIDTLRYDYIGALGNTWIKTPHLDSLAAKSWIFDRSFSASYPTIPHRTDVITGKYGSPIFPWKPLRFDHVTFPELLAGQGYATQLIHDTPHLVNGGHNFDWPFHAWTPVRGAEVDRPWIDDAGWALENTTRDPLFDAIDEEELPKRYWLSYVRSNRHRRKHEDWNAAKLFLTASQWLKENATRSRFLLWVDSFDPHEPWDVPRCFTTGIKTGMGSSIPGVISVATTRIYPRPPGRGSRLSTPPRSAGSTTGWGRFSRPLNRPGWRKTPPCF
jgi:arylsulfatase A-like enzyme